MQNVKQTTDDEVQGEQKVEDVEQVEVIEIETEVEANQSQSSNTEDDHMATKSLLSSSFTEILPGTPIVINNSGVLNVPTSENFSAGICEHKPYEMYTNTTGHYQNIVKVTRKLKFKNYTN
jgi:hypothetical protein